MSRESQIASALDAEKEPEGRYPPVNVQKNGENQESEKHVHFSVDISLTFDDICMNKHATGWNDYRQGKEPNAQIWANQLCLGMIEKSDSMGSAFCKINPVKDPKRYWQCVRAFLKRSKGGNTKLSSTDNSMLRSFVSNEFLFDPGFHHDVEQLKLQLDREKIKATADKKKEKNKKNKGKKKGDEDEEEDEEDEAVEEENAIDQDLNQPLAVMELINKMTGVSSSLLDGAPMRLFGNHIIMPDNPNPIRGQPMGTGNAIDSLTDQQLLTGNVPTEILLEQSQSVCLAAEKDVLIKGKENNEMVPYEGPRIMEKVSFTVTPIYDAYERNVGCWVRFLIRDPLMNPGNFFNEILNNVKTRKQKLSNPLAKHWELFPGYMTKFRTAHPFGDHMTEETYRSICEQIEPGITDGELFVDMVVPSSNTHIFQLFNAERAIKRFEKVGGIGLGRPSDWFHDNQAHFPLKTWKYKAQQSIWHSKELIGLCEQDFPFIGSNAKFLQSLVTARNIKEFMASRNMNGLEAGELEQEVNDAFSQIDKELSKLLVNRRALKDSNLLDYDTPNAFIHLRAKSKVVYKRLQELFPSDAYAIGIDVTKLKEKYHDRWRDFAPESLLDQIKKYEVYCEALKEAQTEMLKDFSNLWNHNASIDDLPISDPIKVMLRWYKKTEHEFPNVTRKFTTWDPELDMFGNTMVQQLHIYVHFARILQPIICMLSEGLFSCYDHDMKELTFNMMVHGRYDTGKTYTAIKTLIDFTTIPGTVSEFSLATKAADVTKKHCYDEMIASDECPEWMVSVDEGKKNQDQVNKEKVKYTRGQLTQRTFTYVTLPNGEKVRWNEDIVSDHKRSCVFVTNHAVEAKGPLSSRMFRHTMKQTTVPANEMNGYIDERITKDTQTWLRLNQYLTTCAKKAAQTGAIYPDVQMDLFNDVANKVFSYLKQWGNISDDAGQRSLDIMRPYARQLIYKMAVRSTFDLPGAIHYEKAFTPTMIQDVQKYLYSTVPIVWWTLTACATEWIDDDDANIIRALIADSNCGWDPEGENPYEAYVNDHANTIPFKVVDPNNYNSKMRTAATKVTKGDKNNNNNNNGQSRPDSENPSPEQLHLDYLTTTGTLEQIARRACTFTNPRMGYDDFIQGVKRLSERNVKLEEGGFKPQSVDVLKWWHRWVKNPDGSDPDNCDGKKHTGPGCPAEYMTSEELRDNHDQFIGEFRTQENIPKRGPNALLPVIDLSDLRLQRLYFMPNAVKIFQQDVLLKALWSAVVCSTMRDGKYLQGFPDQRQPTYMSVSYFDECDIQQHMNDLDHDCGYRMGPGGKMVFIDESIPKHMRPVSRRVGISFNQRGGLTSDEQKVSIEESWAPTASGDHTWKELYGDGAKNMSKTSEIIEDLDYMSALKQHMITGQSIDAPVEDPKYLQAQYERVSRAKNLKLDLDIDYPFQFSQARKVLNNHWDMSSGSSSSVKRRTDTNMNIVFKKSNVSRADRKRVRAEQMAAQQIMAPPPPAPSVQRNAGSRPKKSKLSPPKQNYSIANNGGGGGGIDVFTSNQEY